MSHHVTTSLLEVLAHRSGAPVTFYGGLMTATIDGRCYVSLARAL